MTKKYSTYLVVVSMFVCAELPPPGAVGAVGGGAAAAPAGFQSNTTGRSL